MKSKVAIPKYERVLKEPYTDDEMKLLIARPKTDNWVEWKCWCMINYFFGTGQSRRSICSQNMKVTN